MRRWFHLTNHSHWLSLLASTTRTRRRYHDNSQRFGERRRVQRVFTCHRQKMAWFVLFEDKDRKTDIPLSRPKTAFNEEKVSEVAKSVKEDPHICTRAIISKLALSLGTVHKILHGNLQMKKLVGVWIPHKLTVSERMPVWYCHIPVQSLWAKWPKTSDYFGHMRWNWDIFLSQRRSWRSETSCLQAGFSKPGSRD